MDVLDIASDGDIILIVGSEPAQFARLRVHSLFLKAVSKVFGAMFGPHFREGKKTSRTQPKETLLPEDEAEAMTILCQIIHHNYHDIPDILNPTKVLHVAKLGDKYDCSAILKHAKTRWLDPWPSLRIEAGLPVAAPISELPNLDIIEHGLEYVGCLMAVVYLLDDAGAFQELTSILILHYVKSYLPLANEKWGGSHVPSSVLYMLEEERNLVRTQIEQTFSTPHIYGYRGKIPVITNKLQQAHLTPMSMLELSIMEFVPTLHEVCSPMRTLYPGDQACWTSGGHLIENYHLEFSSHATTRLKQIMSNAGLCLDCMLSGDVDVTTSCRIQHQLEISDGYDPLIG